MFGLALDRIIRVRVHDFGVLPLEVLDRILNLVMGVEAQVNGEW